MKTAVEKGLASHSSNMVAPRDYHREPEDGWTVVISKKNLRKIKKNNKNDQKKNYDASSVVDSVKSTYSNFGVLKTFFILKYFLLKYVKVIRSSATNIHNK